ncbi:hypothetical protein CPB84DRAFT_1682752 [Gymnopilus junonius]|uniref:Uncharacterized protein n=1 Tax=Gymnopilus junonius TaxID=109634 RepID=A0A9P5NKU7_GYMJU|nr:hypothetical protein CPB84DRAFT_1682752 [Gymnopilus junonius]
MDMYHFWDTIPANCITVSGLDFVTGRIIEDELAMRDMKPCAMATSWPNFLRVKTGGAAAFAFFIFTKEQNPDLYAYIQMIEDIRFFLDYVNDLLSFYKEALAGETTNYIYTRARITQKSEMDTLREVSNEVLAAYSRTTEALEITGASMPWKLFANGILQVPPLSDISLC